MSQKKKKNSVSQPAVPKKKRWLRGLVIVLVSLAVWGGACYFCYAYGMNQEKNRLAEMLGGEKKIIRIMPTDQADFGGYRVPGEVLWPQDQCRRHSFPG